MEQKREPQKETGKAPSRREFLQKVAGTGIATAAGVALLPGLSLAGKGTTTPPPQGTGGKTPPVAGTGGKTGGQTGGQTGQPVAAAMGGDAGILNYLLTIERLEAAFYNTNGGKSYLTSTATAGTTLVSTLVGSSETPATNSPATGFSTFVLSTDQTQLMYTVQVTGLTGPATAMHLHKGAPGVSGPIVYPLTPPVNGVATGVVTLNAADVQALLNQGFYINIHTAANPNGEIRGQVVAAPPGALAASSTTAILKKMVDEITAEENAHVTLLAGALGANALTAATFQGLDAPTLTQFLTMAQSFEDLGVSAYLGQVPSITDKGILATVGAVMDVEGRHAGGIRAYRKVASTADGGDPNTTLTEDGETVNRARTSAQVQTALAPFIVGGTITQPGGTTTTTPTTTTPTTTTPTTTTPTTTTPTTPTTPAGGTPTY